MASRLALVTGPKIATTLSRWTSSRVRSTAVLGSVLSSAMTSSNRRPRTPPASFASSIASRVPCTPCWPRFSRPPESGCSTPTLLARPGRGHAVLGDDHLVAEEEGVVHRRAHTDVGDHAEDHQGVHLEVAQREIQIGVEEGRVAPFDDVDVVGSRVQIRDDLGAPAPFEAVRGALEEFAVLAHVRAVSVGDEQDGAAGLPAGVDEDRKST